MMSQEIRSILVAAIKDQDQYLDRPVDLSDGDRALLYTDDGPLDSLSLMTIIADVEKKLLEVFGKKVQLANERDLSTQDSPFRTFGQMISFISTRLAGEVPASPPATPICHALGIAAIPELREILPS